MSACVVVGASGTLEFASDPVTTCPGYVLLDASEYTLQTTLANLVAVPDVSDFAALWAFGFTLPLSLAVVAYCVGSIRAPVNRR